MRIIAGTAKGRRLRAPRGRGTRPTTDRVRAAIFSILDARGADLSRVLDIYAGTGSLGLETLSRGAGWCDFVEQDGATCSVIRENLRLTGLAERGKVHCLQARKVTERLSGPYTLVLMDPPFDDPEAIEVLMSVAQSQLVQQNTVIVFEHSPRQQMPERCGPFVIADRRSYGDSKLAIYEHQEER